MRQSDADASIHQDAPENAQPASAASPPASPREAELVRLLADARAEIVEFNERVARLQSDFATILDLVYKRDQLAAAIDTERREPRQPGIRSRPQ